MSPWNGTLREPVELITTPNPDTAMKNGKRISKDVQGESGGCPVGAIEKQPGGVLYHQSLLGFCHARFLEIRNTPFRRLPEMRGPQN